MFSQCNKLLQRYHTFGMHIANVRLDMFYNIMLSMDLYTRRCILFLNRNLTMHCTTEVLAV